MIGYLRGKLKSFEGCVAIVDVNGVGYEVSVNSGPLSVGDEVEFFIHTHVREDQFRLFGFVDQESLLIFKKLISINGVGPKLGQSILVSLGRVNFLTAVVNGDIDRIKSVSGVGKKVAERLILEMKPYAESLNLEFEIPIGDDRLVESINALVMLGFDKVVAREMVVGLGDRILEMETEEIIKLALSSTK